MENSPEFIEKLKASAKTRFELQQSFEPEHCIAIEKWVKLKDALSIIEKVKEESAEKFPSKLKIGKFRNAIDLNELNECINDAHALVIMLYRDSKCCIAAGGELSPQETVKSFVFLMKTLFELRVKTVVVEPAEKPGYAA